MEMLDGNRSKYDQDFKLCLSLCVGEVVQDPLKSIFASVASHLKPRRMHVNNIYLTRLWVKLKEIVCTKPIACYIENIVDIAAC